MKPYDNVDDNDNDDDYDYDDYQEESLENN